MVIKNEFADKSGLFEEGAELRMDADETGRAFAFDELDVALDRAGAGPLPMASETAATGSELTNFDDAGDDREETFLLAAAAIVGAATSGSVVDRFKTDTVRADVVTSFRSQVQDVLVTPEADTPDKARPDASSAGEYALDVVPSDDLYPNQWHLDNNGQSGGEAGVDLNVTEVWDDYTGEGVVVGIWDDGVQYTHHDLDDNYDTSLHIVIDGDVHNPLPWRPASAHGTSVAGVIAAENNGEGTVGVAI